MARKTNKTVQAPVQVATQPTKKALVKNLVWGKLSLPEGILEKGATAEIKYSRKLRDYAGKGLIKIIKIY